MTEATPTPDERVLVPLDHPLDVRRSIVSHGTHADPTRRNGPGSLAFCGRTPDGPVTVAMRVVGDDLRIDLWGDGTAWMARRGPDLAGHHDDPRPLRFDHDVLDEVNRRHPGVRHGAHGLVVDSLVGRVLGQRVLGREAGRSWTSLCRDLGGPAPGPFDLLLPPHPDALLAQPLHWFHARGIDRGRARTVLRVARHAARLAETVDMDLPRAYGRMRAVPGLGPWTVNGVARSALGDPDAIIVGDYWITHAVVSFFTGRARGTDEEMLELVARWEGQRGRVERLVGLSGHGVERFGPGIRTPDITRF